MTGICILAIWSQNLDSQVQNHIVVATFENRVQSSAHANSTERVIRQPLYHAVSLSLALEVNTLYNVLSVYMEAITVRFMKVGASAFWRLKTKVSKVGSEPDLHGQLVPHT